jgi:hypothetical protein
MWKDEILLGERFIQSMPPVQHLYFLPTVSTVVQALAVCYLILDGSAQFKQMQNFIQRFIFESSPIKLPSNGLVLDVDIHIKSPSNSLKYFL